jgi:heme/copper-type cytochrome/quinol oxidase subunit 2
VFDSSHTFQLESPPAQTEDPPRIDHKVSRFTLAVLGGLAIVLALVGIDALLINGVQAATPRTVVHTVKLTGSTVMPGTVYLTVSPGIKPGADGKLHDAFSITQFTVQAGRPVKLVINNTDSAVHSITAPGAGVNIVVRPGSHVYTLLVHKTGKFTWFCAYPCDPYSMSHIGYMRGYITSV